MPKVKVTPSTPISCDKLSCMFWARGFREKAKGLALWTVIYLTFEYVLLRRTSVRPEADVLLWLGRHSLAAFVCALFLCLRQTNEFRRILDRLLVLIDPPPNNPPEIDEIFAGNVGKPVQISNNR